LKYQLTSDISVLLDSGWGEFVNSHPEGTVFQSPEMYELFIRTGRMKPVAAGLIDLDTGKLKGILLGSVIREMKGPAGYFSARTVIYGGPLLQQGSGDEMIAVLLDALIQQVKYKSVFIQFRNFYDQAENLPVYTAKGFQLRDRLNLLVDTSDMEMVKKHMSSSRVRQVKKGLAMGAKIIEPRDIDQVRDFYNILFSLYRHKVKKPLPGWDFFRGFYELTLENRLGIIRLIEYQGNIIGGILSPVTPGKTIYEWYVCGLDKTYHDVYPSVLATWAAIEYAVEHNIPRFDFMGVGIPERDYGVRDFKARFGGEMVNFGRFARVNNKLVYVVSELGFNVLSLIKKI
jgi:serine/alanine adding enzyme